jgi:FKBP-type peptidyl-prolyl cis-trans isomerase SlpA
VQFELGPEQAYGPRRADLVRHLPLSLLSAEPAGEALAPGVTVAVNDPAGMRVHGVLAALEGAHARVDFNHPLSGHALRVRVQVLGVLDKE